MALDVAAAATATAAATLVDTTPDAFQGKRQTERVRCLSGRSTVASTAPPRTLKPQSGTLSATPRPPPPPPPPAQWPHLLPPPPSRPAPVRVSSPRRTRRAGRVSHHALSSSPLSFSPRLALAPTRPPRRQTPSPVCMCIAGADPPAD
ncbi:hypothetical protein PUN28_006474 [Cardiocondyla obscurior]|uniref:Uncharacterized protein n=1 Tax=Cardiocondyla obscurior TaxID=286306 RepID=A0AAW2GDL0_9HYME